MILTKNYKKMKRSKISEVLSAVKEGLEKDHAVSPLGWEKWDVPLLMILIHPENLAGHSLDDQRVLCFWNKFAKDWNCKDQFEDQELTDSEWVVGKVKNCYNCGGFFSGIHKNDFELVDTIQKGDLLTSFEKVLTGYLKTHKSNIVEVELRYVDYIEEGCNSKIVDNTSISFYLDYKNSK
jgi:hypothetical protein